MQFTRHACEKPLLVVSGLLISALYATPQAYTISAKPGAINYIEGTAFRNGKPISDKGLKATFLDAKDTLSTERGKAEVLLTPGVFLRLGDKSQVRMISPSLTDTQVEVSRGEVMLEAAGLIKDQTVQIVDHSSSTAISKNGLYRFTADDPPTAAVLEGKASVVLGDRKIVLKRGKQVVLAADLKPEKFNSKKEDDLYAWSNVRSGYVAAASYRIAQSAYNSGSGRWRGFGYNGFSDPGWYWNDVFTCWAWLPGAGAFYSPFGYGFYSPALVMNAPVLMGTVYRGPWNGSHAPVPTQIPINPNNPPAVGMFAASPWANQQARAAAARSMMQSGMRTGSGAPVPTYGPSATPDGGWFGPDMPGARGIGPASMPTGMAGGPVTMPTNPPASVRPASSSNPGGMPGGSAGGPPPPSPPAGGGNPGGMPGTHAGPPHE